MRQVVLLGDLVGRIERLEIRCTRCDRAGRLAVAKLIANHGADMRMPDLAVLLAADCPQADAADLSARCFVIFPGLLDLPPARRAHR
jgi:hypothetical protein